MYLEARERKKERKIERKKERKKNGNKMSNEEEFVTLCSIVNSVGVITH